MYKCKKNRQIILIIMILITVLVTGCSNDDDEKQIVINGIVQLPDSTTDNLETNNRGTVSNTISTLSNNVPEDVFTSPVKTAYYNPQEYIIKFTEDIDREQLENQILKKQGKVLNSIASDMYKVKLSDQDNEFINSLQSNPLISYIEPEYLIHIQAMPNDPAFLKQQWNLKMLDIEKTWDSTRGSRDVTVAVLDTGILPEHPDLQGNITKGYDFIDHDDDPTDTDPDFSHGTHVAGIIGAVTNNSEGIAGINWDISIMPVRVIGPGGSGGYSALIAGIHWAVDNGANIINLSLAGSVDSTSLREAIEYAINNNVTVVAAAGNNGSTPILYPAQYPEVISVGAVGPTKERAYYSNYGPNLDIVAPGGDNSVTGHDYNTILSTAGYMDNDTTVHEYTWAQGTSMATPHVAGLSALLYSNGINNPSEIKKLLKDTSDDLGPAGEDNEYGAGLVNINRALKISDSTDDDFADNNSDLIKILATNPRTNKQVTAYADEESRRFSLTLSEGSWTVSATNSYYTGQIDIVVPGDDNIIIELR
ncbi:MAG: S8 family peptidase [Halanaerobiales bacterium]